MKAIKRRITSVKNTQQIMKAMNLVAASKVQKYKNKLEVIRPMFAESQGFMSSGISAPEALESDFFKTRDVKKTAYVVLSGERGLCGSYNANVLKMALSHMEDNLKNEHIIAVGATCKDYFVRRRKNIVASHAGVLENVTYDAAEAITWQLVELYNSEDVKERVDEVYLVYTNFETILAQTPQVVKLLPFDPPSSSNARETIYEPDIETYLRKAVPVYLTMFVYGAMVEASVCEQASRMTSMDAAARNAGEIVDDLTLQFNRQRQSAITQEISEIVGGANAI
jgi:F-type H+-transporting ATPase subunit gamma